MLITHKRLEELTDQHVINLCNKYRSKFLSEEKQKRAKYDLGVYWNSIRLYEVDGEYFRSDFGPAEPAGRSQTRPVEREKHSPIHLKKG